MTLELKLITEFEEDEHDIKLAMSGKEGNYYNINSVLVYMVKSGNYVGLYEVQKQRLENIAYKCGMKMEDLKARLMEYKG